VILGTRGAGYSERMAQKVEEIMTTNPRTVNLDDTVLQAAQVMRDNDIGDAIVVEDGQVTGIVTDRDIAVRAVAPNPRQSLRSRQRAYRRSSPTPAWTTPCA
jgi:CBS domain-containing protein